VRDGSLEDVIRERRDRNLGGQSDPDVADQRFVDAAIDLHLAEVGQVDDRLSFADGGTLFDLLAAAAEAVGLLVRVDDLASLGRLHRAGFDLLVQSVELFVLDAVGEFLGLVVFLGLSLGGGSLQLDAFNFPSEFLGVGFELGDLALVVILFEKMQFLRSSLQLELRLLPGDTIGFHFVLGAVAFFDLRLRKVVILLGANELLAGDGLVALHFFLLLLEFPISILFQVEQCQIEFQLGGCDVALVLGLRDLQLLVGLGHGRVGLSDGDLLLLGLLAKCGRIEFADDLIFFDHRPFRDNADDRGRPFDRATQDRVPLAVQIPLHGQRDQE